MNYHQLTEKERYQIEFLLARGRTKSEIAKELKRHRSTIYREVSRNSLEVEFVGATYDACPAQNIAEERRKEACESRYKVRGQIKTYFESKIERDWSPDQIAGRLRYETGKKLISKNSIYRFIRKDFEDLMSNEYFKKLRFYSPKRSRKLRVARKPRGQRRSVRERPMACEERETLGHFERDLMEGVKGKKAVLVIADRKTRKIFLRLVNRSSTAVQNGTKSALRNQRTRSITNDNGHEFIPRDLNKMEADLGTKIFYCDPHSPWQRGTVENSIGLLRQYFPKRRDLSGVSKRQLLKIENMLNNRPRKILNYRTPSEMYFEEQKK